MVIFDIEANGFYEEATKIHCICLYDMNKKKMFSYFGETLRDGIKHLEECSGVAGHNIIMYDLPLIEKLYPDFKRPKELVDTLVLSRLFNPDRPMGHSLESYGAEYGTYKKEHTDWETFSMDMLDRCERDVLINVKVLESLEDQRKKHNWEASIRLETKIAEVMFDQECNGVQFDRPAAEKLIKCIDGEMKIIEEEVRPILKPLISVAGATVTNPFRKDGSYLKRVSDWMEDQVFQVGGPYTPVKFSEPDLNKRLQIINQLIQLGWKPVNFTPTGQPRLDLASLKGTHNESVEKILLWYQLRQRRSQICNPTQDTKGWLNNLRQNNRIPAKVIPQATNTGRMRHILVANVPKADPSIPYGTETRSLFTCSASCVLVGCDAKGLELRMLAHYMNDPIFSKEVCEGDVHEHNRKSAGIDNRNTAKSFIYAFLYGAGTAKLSKVLKCSQSKAKETKETFLNNLPKLKELIESVEMSADKGWIKGLDGRKVFIRSKHASLNCLLQSAGSIVMKTATCFISKWIKDRGLDGRLVINYHDEYVIECSKKDSEELKQLASEAIATAGKYWGLNVPLEGDTRIGKNWAEVH